MAHPLVVRLGAYAGLASFALALAALIGFVSSVGSGEISESAGSAGFYVATICALSSAVLLVPALLALYAHRSDRLAGAGAVAFLAALVGTILATGGQWTYVFVVPYIAGEAPELVNESSGILLAGFFLSYLALGLGWVAFGATALRTAVYPRWATWLLIAGAVLAIVPMPSRTLVLALAVAVLSVRLLRVEGAAAG